MKKTNEKYGAIRSIMTIVPQTSDIDKEGYKARLYLKKDFSDKDAYCGYLSADKDLTTLKLTALYELFDHKCFGGKKIDGFIVRLNINGKKYLLFPKEVVLVHKDEFSTYRHDVDCIECTADLTIPVVEDFSLHDTTVLKEVLTIPESDNINDYAYFELYRLTEESKADFDKAINYLSIRVNGPLN